MRQLLRQIMFLTPHTTVAIAITQSTGNPVLAFIIGVASHFLLDLIPHGDAGLDRWLNTKPENKIRRMAVIASIDAVIAGFFFLLFWLTAPRFDFTVSFWAAAGAVLPDVIWGLSELFPQNRLLEVYKQKHHLWQGSISDPLSLKWGTTIQFFTLLVSIWLIMF